MGALRPRLVSADIVPFSARSKAITEYDPTKGLKKIVLAELAEKHYARAKDASKLYAAIEEKIRAQAEYAQWRDIVAAQSQERGGPGRGKKGVLVLRPLLPAEDPGRRIVERWRKRFCVTGRRSGVAPAIDAKKIAVALEDARNRCRRICEQEKVGTVRGTEGTGEFERYTPMEYIDAASKVMGEIDLDPASCAKAQVTVRAKKYFTAETDGLTNEWRGRIFLNPPYHRDLMPQFINKLVEEIQAGRTREAILLTNNCTDTTWFAAAVAACRVVCFTHGRIKFMMPNGGEVIAMGTPTQGQAFLYFGPNAKRFVEIFGDHNGKEGIGFCMLPTTWTGR